ncbi:unnamed protein product [Orchesella dallaii]|uniref:HCLS1-associated protein X-1 n=1 Tax=Orchesella dallaii TaxID=48710 RepID=A0ABP1PN05_9HEXA
MEWRDFIRGFFGRSQDSSREHSNFNQWPPPPPIPEFNEELPRDEQTQSGREGGGRSEDHRRFPPEARGGFGSDVDREFEEFGNRFVFGNIFSAMGEMFQEMERSMRDLDGFFDNMRIEEHGSAIPFPSHPAIQDVPLEGDKDKVNERRDKDVNVRDSVLKEPDTPQRSGGRNYISKPLSSEEKVDRDLDELYRNAELDLSDLPVPDCGKSQGGALSPVPTNPPSQPGKFSSTFQRTYQTFSFKNGRWEGEIVKEDSTGKHVTKYFQDEKGERHENTEFYPHDGSSQQSHSRTDEQSPTIDSSMVPHESTRLFQLFDRFFRPRM